VGPLIPGGQRTEPEDSSKGRLQSKSSCFHSTPPPNATIPEVPLSLPRCKGCGCQSETDVECSVCGRDL